MAGARIGIYDSITNGLIELPDTELAIVWPAGSLRRNDPEAFEVARSVFADAAALLANSEQTRRPPKRLLIAVTIE